MSANAKRLLGIYQPILTLCVSTCRFIGVQSRDYTLFRDTYTLRRTLEDVAQVRESLRLPPLEIKTHIIPFATDKERELYDSLREEGRMRAAVLKSIGVTADNNMSHLIEIITRLRQMTANPQLVYDGRDIQETWTGTVTKVHEMVELVSQQPKQSKTLIFTHWNKEAMCIQKALENKLGSKIVRLHGGMSMEEREIAVHDFSSPMGSSIMISQIEAGGIGLNLQAATHLYITSLHWNASSELQAIGRAHRTGVTHKVYTTRLVIEDTIDEYICQLQHKKLGYAAETLGDQRIQNQLKFKLTLDDMISIFGEE